MESNGSVRGVDRKRVLERESFLAGKYRFDALRVI